MSRRNRIILQQQKEKQPEKQISFSYKPIGIYLHSHVSKYPHYASDRIRGEWIANASDKMEIYTEGKKYETIIFHVICSAIHTIPAQIKLLDICDKVWEYNVPDFNDNIKPIDAIIVPTEELKKELSAITDKKIYVIPDRHYFQHYNTRTVNLHKEKAKEAVWFGYAQNAACLSPLINYIKSSGIKLKVIAEKQDVYPLQHADVFVKWDHNTYINEISKADFAILPLNKNYKSNNKEISALLCGIPVAKTKRDITRFINPMERQKEMELRKTELEKYDIHHSAFEYENLILQIKNASIQVYTSICGKFDQPRNDIHVFYDSNTTDKFKMPVMNAKIYKILPHKYFSSHILIYMDGNIFLNANPMQIAGEFLKDADIAVFKHPSRNCLYQEHDAAILRVPEEHRPLMDLQVENYKKEGMPQNFGLAECGMIIRKNNDVVAEFNERWWTEICLYTNRDQMSFTYVWWKMKDRIKINIIEGNVRTHKFFKYENHN